VTVTGYDTHLLLVEIKIYPTFLKPDGIIWPIAVVKNCIVAGFKRADSADKQLITASLPRRRMGNQIEQISIST